MEKHINISIELRSGDFRMIAFNSGESILYCFNTGGLHRVASEIQFEIHNLQERIEKKQILCGSHQIFLILQIDMVETEILISDFLIELIDVFITRFIILHG